MEIKYQGGLKFEIKIGEHVVITDQPKDIGGNDEGVTPGELFVASLASCMGSYVVAYCKNIGIDVSGLTISADSKHADDKPARIGEINININLPAKIEDNRKAAVIHAANHCFVHNTILQAPALNIKLNTL